MPKQNNANVIMFAILMATVLFVCVSQLLFAFAEDCTNANIGCQVEVGQIQDKDKKDNPNTCGQFILYGYYTCI